MIFLLVLSFICNGLLLILYLLERITNKELQESKERLLDNLFYKNDTIFYLEQKLKRYTKNDF